MTLEKPGSSEPTIPAESEASYLDLVGENSAEAPAAEKAPDMPETIEAVPAIPVESAEDTQAIEQVRERLAENVPAAAEASLAEKASISNEALKQQEQERSLLDKLAQSKKRFFSKKDIKERLALGLDPKTIATGALSIEKIDDEQLRKNVGLGISSGSLIAAMGGYSVAIIGAVPVAASIATGVFFGGVAVAGLAYGGLKIAHSLKQRRHRKQFKKVYGYEPE